MIEIQFVQPDGGVQEILAREGGSLMEEAIRTGIDGIFSECGGSCSCARCHVVIDECWQEKAGSPGFLEEEVLQLLPSRQPGSRLSCQIRLKALLDGLVVHIVASDGF